MPCVLCTSCVCSTRTFRRLRFMRKYVKKKPIWRMLRQFYTSTSRCAKAARNICIWNVCFKRFIELITFIAYLRRRFDVLLFSHLFGWVTSFGFYACSCLVCSHLRLFVCCFYFLPSLWFSQLICDVNFSSLAELELEDCFSPIYLWFLFFFCMESFEFIYEQIK